MRGRKPKGKPKPKPYPNIAKAKKLSKGSAAAKILKEANDKAEENSRSCSTAKPSKQLLSPSR